MHPDFERRGIRATEKSSVDAPIIYLDACFWKELENALYKSWELAVFGARRDLGAGSALALHILGELGGGKVQGDTGPDPEALYCPFLAPLHFWREHL